MSERAFDRMFWPVIVLLLVIAAVLFAPAFGEQMAKMVYADERQRSASFVSLTDQLSWATQVFAAHNQGPGGTIIRSGAGETMYVTAGIERASGWSTSEIVADDTRVVVVPAEVWEFLIAPDAVGLGVRVRFGVEDGLKLRTEAGAEVPIVLDAWHYEWEGEQRLGIWLMPANDLRRIAVPTETGELIELELIGE